MPPRLARLVAVLAVVALVGGAFVLRGVLSGDDETVAAGQGSADDDGGQAPPDGYRVICDEDLGEAACSAIEDLDGVDPDTFATLSASAAFQAMSSDEVPYDAWVTLDPWPRILDVGRRVDRLPELSTGEPLGLASSTVAVLDTDRGPDCGGTVTWSCLADAAASGADIGLPTPTSASGTLFLGAATIGLVGEPDFDIREIRSGTVGEQLNALVDSASRGTLAEQNALATRPGQFNALVTIEGNAETTAGRAQGEQLGLTTLGLEPATTIGVVLAPIGPGGAGAVDRLGDQVTDETVTDALAAAGWSGPAAASAGLPEPDLLYALDEEFA